MKIASGQKESFDRPRRPSSGLAIAAVLIGAMLVGAWMPSGVFSATRHEHQVDTWSTQLELLNTSRGESDQFPRSIQAYDVLEESIREVYSDERLLVFASLSRDSKLCLSVFVNGPNEIAGSTCATQDFFAKHGIPFSIVSVDGNYSVYLLPDQVRSEDLAGPFDVATANLLVGDPVRTAQHTRTAWLESGATFQLLALGDPGGYGRDE